MASANTIRAGQAAVEFYADDSKFLAGVSRVQTRMSALGSGVRGIGQVMNAAGGPVGALASNLTTVSYAASGLSSALRALSVHPVLLAMTAIAAIGATLAVVFNRTEKATTEWSDALNEAGQRSQRLRNEDVKRAQELQKLSEKQNLSTSEMDRADYIIRRLQANYGDLGLSINKTTGEIEGLTGAFDKMNARMQDIQLRSMKRELEQARSELEMFEEEFDLGSQEFRGPGGGIPGLNTLHNAQTLYNRMSKEERNENLRQQGRLRNRILDLEDLIREMEAGGMPNDLTGGGGSDRGIDALARRVRELDLRNRYDGHELELLLIHDRYDEELRLAKGNEEKLALIRKAKQLELDALTFRLADDALEKLRKMKASDASFDVVGSFNPATLSRIGPAGVEKQQLDTLKRIDAKQERLIRAVQATGPRFS